MTQISNTNIYYVKMPSWGGYNSYGFMNNDSLWGGEGNGNSSKPANRITWAAHETKTVGDKILAYNIYSGDENDLWGQQETSRDSLNYTMTAEMSNTNAGTVSISGYELTSDTAVAAKNGNTIKALKYTDVTYTATVNEGYTFDGWYDAETGGNLKSEELSFTISAIYENHTYYARYTAIPTINPNEEVANLFTKYYNNGTYTKETVYNTTISTEADIAKYFHASASTKERKTEYTTGSIKMTTVENNVQLISEYKDGTDGVEHYKNGTMDYKVDYHQSVEEWFTTLHDFNEKTFEGWSVSDNVYTYDLPDFVITNGDEEPLLTKMAREFVAPMWLEPNATTGNFVDFDKLTIEENETKDALIMKLYVNSLNKGLVSDENLVLVQSTITIK